MLSSAEWLCGAVNHNLRRAEWLCGDASHELPKVLWMCESVVVGACFVAPAPVAVFALVVSADVVSFVAVPADEY